MEFKNTKGQVVGTLNEKGWYRTSRQASKHPMKKGDAWGVDKAIVEVLKDRNARGVMLYDSEEDTLYAVKLELFVEHSYENKFDFGVQCFLPRRYWKVKTRTEYELEKTTAGSKQPTKDGQTRTASDWGRIWAAIQ